MLVQRFAVSRPDLAANLAGEAAATVDIMVWIRLKKT
jgi:hypothetical protein